ncbi:hypothetical protein TL16_g03533 [Triparma laevis f. inornata]|uniref:Uncharacterized protein n=1 Tax=Triparma laevis f. inornata TaxID=1714386 RepID=A0A9W7E1D5_9STRA|nr:hypothetical protein TL16_g03533 [Triparma laevis f. inornata]
MSKSVASKSKEGHESHKIGGKRGAEDERDENEKVILEIPPAAISTIATAIIPAPASTDQFMHTPEFKRHFFEFVHVQTLMVLRVATKGWNAAADALTDEGVMSGELMVHGGKDIRDWARNNLSNYDEYRDALKAKHEPVKRVIFHLNITKVGVRACRYATNLVVVDIPEGIENIGIDTFSDCYSLTTASFPRTLKSIGNRAFYSCTSLENVDLLHINLKKIDTQAFVYCEELKSMTIPDSLQRLRGYVFHNCDKLVPSNIGVSYSAYNDTTNGALIAHLRLKQQPVVAERIKQARAHRLQRRQAL